MGAGMRIDIFSDTICPWCYLGKRRFELALAARPQYEPHINWRPFELNPDLPWEGVEHAGYLAAKFGDSHHAAAFKVQNLDDTEAYFTGKGIRTVARDDQTLITDPETTFGVPFRWTTWDVPGGPRDTK